MSRNKSESVKGLKLSGEVCIICGWSERNLKDELLLIGAHVRPFKDSSEYDKCNNIVSMCPNHHAQFDSGTITIDPKSHLIICLDSKSEFHNKKLSGKINHVLRGYIDYHFKQIYMKGINHK